jgi:CRISPR-associated endonuclease/helicase Cas3
MNNKRFYAHTDPNNPRKTPEQGANWQLLSDHLQNTAKLAKKFAESFNAGDWGYIAGLWHDLGKYNPEFQDYLNAVALGLPHTKVPHAIWGGTYSYKCLRKLAGDDNWQEVAMSIYGHHMGLTSPGKDISDFETFWETAHTAAKILHSNAQRLPLPKFIPSCKIAGTKRELRIKMLFSALIDADSIDTEQHFNHKKTALRSNWIKPVDLLPIFRAQQLQMMWSTRRNSHVNLIRRRIYRRCVASATKPPGVFRLTVPTGGGKTRSALAFALRHALHHSRDRFQRIIVALPYTSIIDQTAEEYRRIFGEHFVLEHHSQVKTPEENQEDEQYVRQRLASENWDYPLIVTTTVQLFESLFAHRRGACRKLHNIARSILILDEVQTLPPELLDPTMDVIRLLVDDYGVTVVFSTATQPAFDQTPYLKAFKGLSISEIVPDYAAHFAALERVEYQPVRQLQNIKELVDELTQLPTEQFLVIMNTRRHALELYKQLQEKNITGLYHLSSLLCGAHRKHVLTEVKKRLDLRQPQPVRLIATQVVEAGVDLDFPFVYRAMGPLDRIVQAAGRCNREGLRVCKGQVTIFDWPSNTSPPGAYKLGLDEAKKLLQGNGADRLSDPNLYTEYFQCLFCNVNLDKKDIQSYRRDLNYPEVAQRYKLIEDTVPVVITKYDNGEGEKRLKNYINLPSRESWRRLLPYVVNLRQRDISTLSSWLEPITEKLYRWTGIYDAKTHRGLVEAIIDPVDLYY